MGRAVVSHRHRARSDREALYRLPVQPDLPRSAGRIGGASMTTQEPTRAASWLKVAGIGAVFAIVFAACSSGGGTAAPASQPAASEAPQSAAPASGGAPASAGAGGGDLFVAINKAADQQYFIDLQTSFKAKIEELGGTAAVFDAKDQA